jgi:hypothetical protein
LGLIHAQEISSTNMAVLELVDDVPTKVLHLQKHSNVCWCPRPRITAGSSSYRWCPLAIARV